MTSKVRTESNQRRPVLGPSESGRPGPDDLEGRHTPQRSVGLAEFGPLPGFLGGPRRPGRVSFLLRLLGVAQMLEQRHRPEANVVHSGGSVRV